ncbi:MAG: DUF370 domain-containing protein [Bacillota bacterium]|nr:DUF370 domain-containing protein [Bacillota bacterium]
MFIHLGNDLVISTMNMIAIINIEEPISADLKEILEIAEMDRKLINVSEKEKRKSMVICDEYVYVSPISSNTLHKRAIHYYKEG